MTRYFARQFTNFIFSNVFPFRVPGKVNEWKFIEKDKEIGIFRLRVNTFTERPVQYVLSLFNAIMGKKAGGFYAVARGRSVGIYNTWDDCKAQVDGFPNARYKKFPSSDEAQSFINEHRGIPGGTTSTSAPSTKKIQSSTSIQKQKAGTSSLSSSAGKGIGMLYAAKKSGSGFLQNSGILSSKRPMVVPPPIIPSLPMPNKAPQKRDLSFLKVTEDRVVNKRTKRDPGSPNKRADLSSFTVDEDGYVVVFTDGACAKNGRKAAKAGIGVWFGHNHPSNISEPVDGRQTNNTAEIQAAERAIKRAKENGINKLKVKTDSQFTINCVTKWLNNWRRNNWRLSSGGEVKNKEDLIKLDEAMQNMEIKWSYVAGHAGIEGNEAADRLAVSGAERKV